MPIEYAVPKVHRFLQEEGVRDKMTVIASGGIRTPHDVAKIIALGAPTGSAQVRRIWWHWSVCDARTAKAGEGVPVESPQQILNCQN